MFRLFQEDIRAGDADREDTVEILKRHYAEGRLSSDELSSRIDAAYAAIGLLELDALTRDLPPVPQPPANGRPARGRGAATLLAATLGLIAVLVIVSALPPELWTLLIFFGAPLVMMGLFVLLPVALPVLAMAWLSRSLDAFADSPSRKLARGSGWVSITQFGDARARRHQADSRRRRRTWLNP